jgi:3' terminal RNA ribose 2'-O-methyltransferase Hen1
MLLAITTTQPPASDLGYLLHKHPDRFQSFDLSFGQAHVFYPELSEERCTACLMLDVDPVGMVRKRNRNQSLLLGHYVNDRPYVASSFMSVAISQVFGTALAGRCKDRPELVATPLPLVARIETLPVRGGDDFLHRVFEPLGYEVQATRRPLDSLFPEWGESPYFSVTLAGVKTLSELLTHLYVLIPVFDNEKHYFVGEDELEKLLVKGTGWLASHPEKDQIARRYLRHRANLYREALARIAEVEEAPVDSADETAAEKPEDLLERPLSLNEERHGAVLAAVGASAARSVLDLGCGEGKLLQELLKDRQFERILGMDVSVQALERAARRLGYDRLPPKQEERIELIHGSLIYRDKRLSGFDAAAVVEVIEHLDPPRLSALERVLFEFARPKTVVVTTPNREYNVKWETLPAGKLRHPDHRFEWTRPEFQAWGESVAQQHGYNVRFLPIGPIDDQLGAPTQMGVFERG